MNPKKRPHLRTKTTSVLNALAEFGAGGATAEQLARACGLRTRQASMRCNWLRRGGLVQYVPAGQRWRLTDDSMFQGVTDGKA